jgi:hypothetical protein
MGLIKTELRMRYYPSMDHTSRETFLMKSGNQCEITTKYMHEDDNVLCSQTRAVSYMVYLIPDKKGAEGLH